MILDTLFRVLTIPLKALLSVLPSLNIEIPADVFLQINEFIKMACYFLPVKTIVVILGLKLAMWGFKITMSIIVRAKSFVPTMGS